MSSPAASFFNVASSSRFSLAASHSSGGFHATRQSAVGSGSSDSSQPRFEQALEAAKKPAAEQPATDKPAADSADRDSHGDAVSAATDQKATPQDRTGVNRNARRSESSATKGSKTRSKPADAGNSHADDSPTPIATNDPSTAADTAGVEKTDASAAPSDKTPPTPSETAVVVPSDQQAVAISQQADAAPTVQQTTPPKPEAATGRSAGNAGAELPATTSKDLPPEGPKPSTDTKKGIDKPVAEQLTKPPTGQIATKDVPDAKAPVEEVDTEATVAVPERMTAKQAGKTVRGQNESTTRPMQNQIPQQVQQAQAATAQVALRASAETVGAVAQAVMPNNDEAKPPTGQPQVIAGATTTSLPVSEESAEPAATAQQVPPSQLEQTFDQVVMGLRGKLDAQNGKAEIRLDPPNLGTLHVSISLTNGSLTAQFQSASDVVRDLLKGNMEKLKNVLEAQGVTVDKLAVEAPVDKIGAAAVKAPPASPPGSPNHDGRSAGQYSREPQSGQKRSQGGSTFAGFWRDGVATGSKVKDAPIDVVA